MATLPFILDPEESRVLEEEQIFLGGPTNGKRKVSAALLSNLPLGISSTLSFGIFKYPNC
jgi:hypothetical protein